MDYIYIHMLDGVVFCVDVYNWHNRAGNKYACKTKLVDKPRLCTLDDPW